MGEFTGRSRYLLKTTIEDGLRKIRYATEDLKGHIPKLDMQIKSEEPDTPSIIYRIPFEVVNSENVDLLEGQLKEIKDEKTNAGGGQNFKLVIDFGGVKHISPRGFKPIINFICDGGWVDRDSVMLRDPRGQVLGCIEREGLNKIFKVDVSDIK